MEPEKFPEANTELTAPAEMGDCGDLPVYRDDEQIISMWKLTWKERLAALIFGRVWLRVYTPSGTHPPIGLEATRQIFVIKKE